MLIVDNNKKIPLYEQLFFEIRRLIISGEYKPDQQLKPIRVLADELEISHNTVIRAYQELVSEGYVRTVQGSGYYVEELATIKELKNRDICYCDKDDTDELPIHYDFHYDRFSTNLFPWSKWRRYLQQAIAEESYTDKIMYEENKGNYLLRKSICDHILKQRGIHCTPEQVVICSGTQYALNIIMDILPDISYNVGFEEPGYDGMRQIFLNRRCKISSVNVTEKGIDANQLERMDCNLLYITPSHQFPTGATLPMAKRLQILEWSRRNKVYVIENDYDCDFLFGERPLLSMQSLDRNGYIIYMNTFAKVLTPEIRCAFLVLPQHLVSVYDKKYSNYYSSLSGYEQRALYDFIEDGNLMRQSRKMANLSQRKNEIVRKVFKEQLCGIVEPYATNSGTHILVRIKGVNNPDDMIDQLRKRKIQIYSTHDYWHVKENEPKDLFLIGYSCIEEKELENACMELAYAIKEILGIL
ncbi:MAG: PLP-dependent aminotransferase family protein [Coprococcus sp.]